MPVQPDFYTAMTDPDGVNAIGLRNSLRKRAAYVLAANESATDLIATDPVTGVVFLSLVQNGRVYAFDPLDTSSAHDGVTVLVTYDGLVYKLDSLVVPYSVISKSYTSPPAGSVVGDSYLIVGAGSGDWAGKGPLVSLTTWGWESISAPPGRLIYVEDEDAYYHVDRYGNVLAGFGSAALSTGSVLVRHFLGGGRSFHFTVVNQTTNTPPTLTGGGNQYIVGSAPTGPWAGKTGWVAVDEGASWGLYQPSAGWRAYDIAQGNDYRFDGTSWISQAGALLFYDYKFTQASINAVSGTVGYTYSTATAPTTSSVRVEDPASITRTARNQARLRLSYQASLLNDGSQNSQALAIYRDAGSTAIAWQKIIIGTLDSNQLNMSFVVTAPDALPHTYKVAAVRSGTTTVNVSLEHRLFQLEEFA